MNELQTQKGPNALVVDADNDARRLDRFVQATVPGAGFGLVQKLIRKGAVRVDGKRAKPDTRVTTGQSVGLPQTLVDLMRAPGPAKAPTPQQSKALEHLKARIIVEENDIVVFDKPAGLAVQGGSKTLVHVDGLLAHFADGDGRTPKLVHRLDRDTSGVLLTARGANAAELGKQFAGRETNKRYLAWCWGVPDRDAGRIDAPLLKRAGKDRSERVVVDQADGQHAVSTYRVVGSGRTNEGLGPRLSLIEWSPLTGRTHQLRVHAVHLGNSIVGDPKYGRAPKLGNTDHEQHLLANCGLMLHAHSIEIEVQGRRKTFKAALPSRFVQIAEMLGIDTSEFQG